jgi:DNA polymerase/3'-5' exonuclease PolX
MDYKSAIVEALDVMRQKEVLEKQPFKARAYATVIRQLKQMEKPVTSFEDIYHFQGMGDAIRKKIQEIIETGSLQSAERVKANYSIDTLQGQETLTNIYGIGPAKARELVHAGIYSVEQLRAELKRNPLILNDKQTIGLLYYEDLLQRIPREEMMEHQEVLDRLLPNEWETEIVGSFRRGQATSGDIDMLIRVPPNVSALEAKRELASYVSAMKEAGYVEEVLALGDHKCMAICRIGDTSRRLDLLLTPDEEYAYALLYFTGSDQFNVAFRHHALEKGYTLNEHRLTPLHPDTAAVPPMIEEKDIFRFLGLRYVEPHQRVDKKQIVKSGKPRISQVALSCSSI